MKTYLGGCVARRATRRLQGLVLLVHVGEAEIHNLQSVVVVEQQIFRLKISVANATLVEVLNTTNELPVEFGSLFLIKTSISDDKVEKLATVSMLHNHEKFLLSFDNLKQPQTRGQTAEQN